MSRGLPFPVPFPESWCGHDSWPTNTEVQFSQSMNSTVPEPYSPLPQWVVTLVSLATQGLNPCSAGILSVKLTSWVQKTLIHAYHPLWWATVQLHPKLRNPWHPKRSIFPSPAKIDCYQIGPYHLTSVHLILCKLSRYWMCCNWSKINELKKARGGFKGIRKQMIGNWGKEAECHSFLHRVLRR